MEVKEQQDEEDEETEVKEDQRMMKKRIIITINEYNKNLNLKFMQENLILILLNMI